MCNTFSSAGCTRPCAYKAFTEGLEKIGCRFMVKKLEATDEGVVGFALLSLFFFTPFFPAFFWGGCGLDGVIIIMIANDMIAAAIHQFCLFERKNFFALQSISLWIF